MIASVETAIILEVPEAEALVGALRLEGDYSASMGVPAHVTLIYPFVEDPTASVVSALTDLFATVPAFDLDFVAVGEFPEVVYLAPNQAAVVQDLIALLEKQWPECPPYGGVFDTVVPHLTVVDTPDFALRARARDHVMAGLPLTSSVSRASLWVHDEGTPWRCVERFPLAE